jgi:hypothetical protein
VAWISVAVPAAFLLAVTLGPKPSPERYEPLDSPFDFDAFGGVVLVIDQLAQVVTFLAMVVAAGLVAAGAALALIGLALGTSALMGSVATQAFVALLPVAIGAAILRYRLFDLDRIISRTLAYGLLTVLLGSAYAAVVLGLGQLLPEDSSLVVAAATLTVAAVVGPARRRIQAAVDRRFNRRRHDAAQKIAAFSGRLHQQIDLDTLTLELLAVVEETMQPAQASLWLRPPQAPSVVVDGVVAQQRS